MKTIIIHVENAEFKRFEEYKIKHKLTWSKLIHKIIEPKYEE